MEAVLARVEWSTLLFFAALFVLMEALSELGLIDWIGRQTENVILSVGEESRLAVAILIILWVNYLNFFTAIKLQMIHILFNRCQH
jgi:Na+/H+ antiporter NhaD/arsenite permease-like protein